MIGRTTAGNAITALDVAVEFEPGDRPLPRLVDLRVRLNRPNSLLAVERGDALISAGKNLVYDQDSEQPWIQREDGSYQILVLQSGNVAAIPQGRLLRLRFSLNESGPVEVSLVRHEQTFAPPESDAVLQVSGYDAALVVTR